MHDRGVVHRDIKMENIMLDEKKKNLKIVDFGLSNTFSQDNLLKTHCGSPEYAAPELFISDKEYGPEVDLWSLGINMFAMVTGRLPFSTPYTENRRQRLMQQIQNGLGVIHGREMAHLSQECQEILGQLIEPSPELRLPLLDVEVHPWITNMGETAFYPYQQPPKDMETRRLIVEKTACLLRVNIAKIEGSVHEYRLDDISAVFNLMMDQHLLSKGFWDRDHTIKKEVKRLKTIEVVVMSKTPPPPPQESQDPDEENIELRTPTIIGMVRPSQQNPERRNCLSADFELSAVSYEGRPRTRRAKTATFPETGVKTRPFGNATTANSVIARNYNFGPPSSSAQPPKVYSCPPASKTGAAPVPKGIRLTHPVQSQNRSHPGDSQPTNQPIARTEEIRLHEAGQTAGYDQPQSKGDGPIGDANPSQYHTKQQIKKIPVTTAGGFLFSKDSNISQIKTNAESAHDVKVIDMAKYFNYKHGYIVKETSLSNCSSQKPQETPRQEENNSILPGKVYTVNRDNIVSETASQQDESSCDTSRANSPTKSSSQRSELARQKMKLPSSPVNAHFRPHHADPTLQKSLLLTKRALQCRFSQASRASAMSKGKPTSSQSGSKPRSHQCVFSLSKSGCDSPRARLPTPVAMLQSVDDCQRARKTHARQEERVKEDSVRRKALPLRLEWKRSSVGKSSCWIDEMEGKTTLDEKREASAKMLQEMMSKDSIHQRVPDDNIRVSSAKLVSPAMEELNRQGTQRKNEPSESSCRRSPCNVHKSCMTQTQHRGCYKMDKYGHKRSHTYPSTKQERLIDLGEQHMASLLQEASTKFEDSIRKAAMKGRHPQSFRKRRNHKDSIKSNQGGSTQEQQNIHGQGPPEDDQQNISKGTVALQLGQRVQIVKGSLTINSKPPPVLPNTVAPQQVFNVHASRDIKPVAGIIKSKQGAQKNISRKQRDKEWDAGYRLERKVSDTIKRGGSAIRRTPDLLLNCT